ncbi:MAG: outer membrane protein assembly factor BamD [Bdellovibrionales bacterium]|nr:outer membrane protein assembly factor BamD [Bdellovibrionales bacterium]
MVVFLHSVLGASALASDLKKIESDLKSVSASIELTKKRIKGAQEIEFLPDLYFMLGELLVDKAKLSYAVKREKNPKVPIEELDFAPEKQIRLEAIETYRIIEERYPRFQTLDKVLFTQGQELLELNETDQALKVMKKVTERFPKSPYFAKALIEIGNIFFNKKDFDFALEQYQKVIDMTGPNAKKEVAYYKAALCYIHKDSFLTSMVYFDRFFRLMKNAKIDPSEDIREEALIASVWPISELSPEDLQKQKKFLDPISYYREVAFDKASYRRVLNRYGKRMTLKVRIKEAHLAYLELFRLADELSEKKEAMENFYLKGREVKVDFYPSWVCDQVAKTLWRIKQEDVEKPKEKKEILKYEAFYRDFTTTLHKAAMRIKRQEDLKEVVKAYEQYIWIFPKTEFISEIYLNMAEASFHAKDYIHGGQYYSQAASLAKKSKDKRDLLDSAVGAFALGFAEAKGLSNLEKAQGRAGLQRTASIFTKEFPNDPALPTVKFNLAKSYYDEQTFSKSADLFKAFVNEYPSHELAEQAAILLIDSYYIQEDLQGVVREGKALQSHSRLSAPLRSKMAQVVAQAQLKKVRSIAGEMGSKDYADKFLEFAAASKGSNTSEPALYEAFSAIKASNDPRVFEVGEQYLGQYGNNPRSQEVLVSIAQKAMISVDYRRAIKYLFAFGQKFKNESSAKESITQAGLIADSLGDSAQAAQAFLALGDTKKAAEIYARAHRWDALVPLAAGLQGSLGLYYQGLGIYRQGSKPEGLALLRRLSDVTPSNDEEKMLLAHAGIIVAEYDVEQFVGLGKGEPFSVPLLQKKIQAYQSLDLQLQKVIGSGAGKWVIAGLMNNGQLNQNFAQFLQGGSAASWYESRAVQKNGNASDCRLLKFGQRGLFKMPNGGRRF